MKKPTNSAIDTPFTLRPFQNADAPAVARLYTASVRDHWTYQPEHFRESSDPQKRRLIAERKAERDDEVIATAHLYPFGSSAPDALRLDLSGDGAAFSPLYLDLLARLPAGFTRLLGITREDFHEQMHFFTAAGFRNAWQSWGAHLDLKAFDFEQFRALDEKLFLAGYEVQQWDMNALNIEWDALHALYLRGVQDAPRNPTTTEAPMTRQEMQAVMTREETVFIARLKGEIVALTRLNPHEHQVESDLTTTHPAHRSKGLATLVKARTLAWAKKHGYTHAGTGGTVLNLAMLRVNTRLGYVTEPMWVTWERKLDDHPLT